MKNFIFLMIIVCMPILANDIMAQTQTSVEAEDEIYTIVDIMPEFPGGQEGMVKFLQANVEYPADAKKKNMQGKVYIKFMVDETGKIQQAFIMRGVYPSIDAEALRVVNKMPKWKPGSQGGRVVKVWFVLPLDFTLN